LLSAHCPLCTAGAGALAVLAASLGVATPVVGIFIGAFATALGLWMARLLKKKYIKYQDAAVSVIVYLLTIIPIMPFIIEYRPLYVSFFGEYGTLFHNTYLINLYIFGAILGAVLLFIAPYLSRVVTRLRTGKIFPFQGLGITFILLIVVGVILQLTI
jgi:hypothetical protein